MMSSIQNFLVARILSILFIRFCFLDILDIVNICKIGSKSTHFIYADQEKPEKYFMHDDRWRFGVASAVVCFVG